ncbi:very short patch repair endonuclease [Kordiimonas laminariae]|uniref:very short patch repair endonuclease n=1 Tax=Kordiimonas laminariae TaxID=2917717 RepID=UPI001FF46357|nr:very short patch repair endonuclease [Kordiimonas laminariae]MCK0070861.1 very short patch repair endonuclease [Kordiimonas laminariae]
MDVVTPEKRSQMMAGIKGKNTKPELIIRKELFRRGFRYRLHGKKLPGKPDIILPKYKTVVFVNGCFWHKHDCHLFKWPKTRTEFWREKILGNVARDKKNRDLLKADGWKVITIWECAIKNKSYDEISLEIDKLAESLLNTEYIKHA